MDERGGREEGGDNDGIGAELVLGGVLTILIE
jgi:hypothetical protein